MVMPAYKTIDKETKEYLLKEVVTSFGEWMGMHSKDIEAIHLAVNGRDAALNAPGILANEYNHPIIIHDILRDMKDFPKEAKRIILEHHERSDGSGYPYGLKDDKISNLTKILSICEEYINLRMRSSKEETIKGLVNLKDILNANLLNKFITFLSEYRESVVLILNQN